MCQASYLPVFNGIQKITDGQTACFFQQFIHFCLLFKGATEHNFDILLFIKGDRVDRQGLGDKSSDNSYLFWWEIPEKPF